MESLTSHENSNITILDLFLVFVEKRVLIFSITLITMIVITIFSLVSLKLPSSKSLLPNVYTSRALMLINDSTSSGGSFSSMLSSSGLGSLANLAGINVSGGSTYSALAVYLTGTNEFLDAVIDKFGLITKYKVEKSPRTTSRNILKNILVARIDKESSVFSISFTDIDPVFAQSVVNFATNQLEKRFEEIGVDKNKLQKENLERNLTNTLDEIQRLETASQRLMRGLGSTGRLADGTSFLLESTRLELELEAQKTVYTELKTQYELTKVKMASETPVFQILEYAEVPDQKSGPSRGKLCIIVTFAAFFFSVFLAFLLNAIDNIKKDPEAMAKLKGNRS